MSMVWESASNEQRDRDRLRGETVLDDQRTHKVYLDGRESAAPEAMSEFDRYAAGYAGLLRDPFREKFAPGSHFFIKRKLLLLQDFYSRRGVSTTAVRWLDIGCGQGELLRLGMLCFPDAAGCDISAGMIAHCRGLNVRQQKSSERVPFPGASFDLATAVCLFHHVEPAGRAALVREGVRVLKPGGIFCLIEHNPFNPVTQLIVRRTPVDANAMLLSAGSARRLLRAAGLEVLDTRHFLYFPERIYKHVAFLEARLAALPLGGQYAVFARKT